VAGRPADGEAGAACVPIAADVARFWITRLHGPDANDSAAVRSLGIAAQQLSEGDEAGAQKALDASGLTRLSPDGVVLMRAVAGSLGIGPLCPGGCPKALARGRYRSASAFVQGRCGSGIARQGGIFGRHVVRDFLRR
jgi:hypothetical protein